MRAVPDGFEHAVGQPGTEYVLHRRHGQEVVYPEYRRLGHQLGEQPVQLDGAVQVFAEGLLQDDLAARRQARIVQSGDGDGENGRREGEVGGDRSVAGDDIRDAGYVGDIGLVVTRRRHDRLPGGGGKLVAVTIELSGRPLPEILD